MFVLDTFDTDKFQFNDLDVYLQSGAGFNRANPYRSCRIKSGRRTIYKSKHQSDKSYDPIHCDEKEQHAIYTRKDGSTFRTTETTGADDATRFDEGASDTCIGFDFTKCQRIALRSETVFSKQEARYDPKNSR
ncbi:hypothetical protein DPMN_053419 [Dreissena polymorpha]|uniref:Uncharacterized protein n=1 Tax=Dreissena polymorpha TaxID=45954 RepID=A0A9D4HQN1_DREPO|nr:hypothetical protein DPMN_053419 [Dreissena polymorpha]